MNSLIESYINTKYIVFEPTLTIEIGKLNQDLDGLLIKHNSNEWAFITAYNPYSKILNDEENKLLHSELKELTKNYITFENFSKRVAEQKAAQLTLEELKKEIG